MHFWRTRPGSGQAQVCCCSDPGPRMHPGCIFVFQGQARQAASQFRVENSSETWYVEPPVVPGWRQWLLCTLCCSHSSIQDSLEPDATIPGNFDSIVHHQRRRRHWVTLSHYHTPTPKYSHMFQNPHSLIDAKWISRSRGGIRRKLISHSLLLPGTIHNWVRCSDFRHAPKTPRKQSGLISDIFGIRAAKFPKTPAAQYIATPLAGAFKLPTYFLLLSGNCCQLPPFRDSHKFSI